MKEQALKKNAAIAGSFICKEAGQYYNRMVWMGADGTYSLYDKRHLFRMGEEHNHYTGGQKKLIVEIKGWKICPLVCYDLRFPVWSRNKIEARNKKKETREDDLQMEYDVLIYVANWPERRAHPWKSLLVARAIENQSFVIGVNRVGEDGNKMKYSGDSAVLDFKGEIVSRIPAGQEFIETITLNYHELSEFRKAFPVLLDADDFQILQ
jgi:predicted amidohydrolase